MFNERQNHRFNIDIELQLIICPEVVAASAKQQIQHKKCSALVPVDETVIQGQRLNKRRSLFGDGPIISAIRPSYGRFYRTKIAYPLEPAKGQCEIVRDDNFV